MDVSDEFSVMLKAYAPINITATSNSTASAFDVTFNIVGWVFSILVAFPTNCYVIWLIVTGRGNGVASEFFSLNLSVCELMFCLQSFFSLLSIAFPSLWLVVRFLIGFSFTGRPLFQCLICLECYLAVVHPVTFLKFKPLRYRVLCSSVVFIIILISCVFGYISVVPTWLYMFVCFSELQAVFTLSVKLFCCLAVLRALKQSGPGERGRKREEENHMKRRAFNIILIILMAMIIVYSAFLLAGFIYIFTNKYIPALWNAGHFSFVLGGLVQPLLYLHRTGRLSCCKPP